MCFEMGRVMSGNQEERLQKGERLQKVLARAGFGSRRASERLIVEGRVKVDNVVAVLGTRAYVDVSHVEVDGVPVNVHPDFVSYLLNKPKGVITAVVDTHERPVVMDLVPDEPRVFPVGRLDLETEGLLLLTNDGDFAHKLTHPSFGVAKEYLAYVTGSPKPNALRRLRDGVDLDGQITYPAKVSLVDRNVLRLTIKEGRNRQVRRMCEAVGHPVRRLVRTRLGSLSLSDARLRPGEHRKLTCEEVRMMERAAAVRRNSVRCG